MSALLKFSIFTLALPPLPIILPLSLSICSEDFAPNSRKLITCKVFSPLSNLTAFCGENPLPIAVIISKALKV